MSQSEIKLTAENRKRVLELAAMTHAELTLERAYGAHCPECEKSRWIERLLAIIDAEAAERREFEEQAGVPLAEAIGEVAAIAELFPAGGEIEGDESLAELVRRRVLRGERAEKELDHANERADYFQRQRAELFDQLKGTPCEQVRHTQEVADLRDAIGAEARDCGCSSRILARIDGDRA